MNKGIPEIDLEKCVGCGECVELCSTKAVELINGKAAIIKPENCNYCTDCEAFCFSGAIRCHFEIILMEGD